MKTKRMLTTCCVGLIAALGIYAEEVTNKTAGEIGVQVKDKNSVELKVNGPIDVRDIKFIVEEMASLQTIDLSQADIKAYKGDDKYFGEEVDYGANSLPTYCFFGKKYSKVVLPKTLKSIEEGSMAGCENITELTLPSGLEKIGDYSLNGLKGLKKLTLPASVAEIGDYAFARSGIEEVDMSSVAATATIGIKTFSNCTSLSKVELPGQCEAISDGMFSGCEGLKEIILPASLKSIGAESFMQTSLDSIDFRECTGLKVIGRWAFAVVPMAVVKVNDGIETIGEGAFYYNDNLRGMDLPSGLREVSDFMMAGCKELAEGPKVGEGVTRVGQMAFADMSKMDNATLPSTLEKIGDKAFENCTGMTELTSNATAAPEVGKDVWAGVNQGNVRLKVPESSISVYKASEQWKEFMITDLTGLDITQIESDIKAYFAGTELNIKATSAIKRVSVYDPSGVMLAYATPEIETAKIETANYGGKLYVVVVVLDNGKRETLKLVRR